LSKNKKFDRASCELLKKPGANLLCHWAAFFMRDLSDEILAQLRNAVNNLRENIFFAARRERDFSSRNGLAKRFYFSKKIARAPRSATINFF
jgi:hypothetical protein